MKPATSMADLPIDTTKTASDVEGHASNFFQVLDESMCVVREDLSDWLQRYIFSSVDAPTIPATCLLLRLQSGLWLSRLAHKLHLSVLGGQTETAMDQSCKYKFMRGAVSNLQLKDMSSTRLPPFPSTLVTCAKLPLQPRDTCSFDVDNILASQSSFELSSKLSLPHGDSSNSNDLFSNMRVADRWIARDNVSCFINWCNKLGIPQTVLFETTGLVHRTEEKNVLLTLMELARIASRFGLTDLPELVRMEREIDAFEAILAEKGEQGITVGDALQSSPVVGPTGDYYAFDESLSARTKENSQLHEVTPTHPNSLEISESITFTNNSLQPALGNGSCRNENASMGVQSDDFDSPNVNGSFSVDDPAIHAPNGKRFPEKTPVRRSIDQFVASQTPRTIISAKMSVSEILSPLQTNCDSLKRKTHCASLLFETPVKRLRCGDFPSPMSPTNTENCKTPVSVLRNLNLEEEEVCHIRAERRDSFISISESTTIAHQVEKKVAQCNCCSRIHLHYLSEGRYRLGNRIYYFRRFRNHVMVRIGGGWLTLDDFLNRHDPCRRGQAVKHDFSYNQQQQQHKQQQEQKQATQLNNSRPAVRSAGLVRKTQSVDNTGVSNARSINNLSGDQNCAKLSSNSSPLSPRSVGLSVHSEDQQDSDYSSLGSTVIPVDQIEIPEDKQQKLQEIVHSLPPSCARKPTKDLSNGRVRSRSRGLPPSTQLPRTESISRIPQATPALDSLQPRQEYNLTRKQSNSNAARPTIPRGPLLRTVSRARDPPTSRAVLNQSRPNTPTSMNRTPSCSRLNLSSAAKSRSCSTTSIPQLVKKTF